MICLVTRKATAPSNKHEHANWLSLASSIPPQCCFPCWILSIFSRQLLLSTCWLRDSTADYIRLFKSPLVLSTLLMQEFTCIYILSSFPRVNFGAAFLCVTSRLFTSSVSSRGRIKSLPQFLEGLPSCSYGMKCLMGLLCWYKTQTKKLKHEKTSIGVLRNKSNERDNNHKRANTEK